MRTIHVSPFLSFKKFWGKVDLSSPQGKWRWGVQRQCVTIYEGKKKVSWLEVIVVTWRIASALRKPNSSGTNNSKEKEASIQGDIKGCRLEKTQTPCWPISSITVLNSRDRRSVHDTPGRVCTTHQEAGLGSCLLTRCWGGWIQERGKQEHQCDASKKREVPSHSAALVTWKEA